MPAISLLASESPDPCADASPQRDTGQWAIRFRDQREEAIMQLCRNALRALGALVIGFSFISGAFAQGGNPIRIGMSLALTGAGAAPSKVINTALEIWRDDVNGKGGLLGRPVELVIYDDQSAPANVPNIYTKLITVDKVDLLLGPYGTNFVAPAMPTIIQNNKMTISFTAIGINDKFHYPKYFSMVSTGPEGVNAFSIGFFDLAAAQTPKPQTVAILAADAEFAQSAAHGAREEIKKHGLKVVYDKSYPPSTTDFAPVVRAMQATNPDIVYVGAYPPDNVGIIRAADEIGLSPKMMGGAMIGMLVTPIKVQLGPVANGLIVGENVAAASVKQIAGGTDFLARYGERAVAARIDPLGFAWGPFAYSAGQALAQAVTETKSLDHDKLAEYMHEANFKTVSGDFSFGKDGEWSKSRMVWTQVQNAQPNNLDQFRDGKAQPIVWPPEARTGTLIYPYEKARQK
jgi:branched-chain amino acid transport system substrate-binding protein